MSFSTCRVVSFKLKNQIIIDDLIDKEFFTIKRPYMQGSEIKSYTIECKLTRSNGI